MGEWARGCIEFLPLLNGANRPPSLRYDFSGRNLRRLRLVALPGMFAWATLGVPSVPSFVQDRGPDEMGATTAEVTIPASDASTAHVARFIDAMLIRKPSG